jgi:hypothetical protein
MEPDPVNNEEIVEGYLVRLNGRAWGMALGALFAIGIFVATNFLVLKGGETPGQHLGLLGQYFPGYDVNFLGSIIGAAYAFVAGYLIGRIVCGVYNTTARR